MPSPVLSSLPLNCLLTLARKYSFTAHDLLAHILVLGLIATPTLRGAGTSRINLSTAITITLSPQAATHPLGTQRCVVATVTETTPLQSASLNFSVTGVNSATGTATTNALGQAFFCYTGSKAGTDTIKVSLPSGTSATTTKIWRVPPAVVAQTEGAVVRHAPNLSGRVEGSVRMLLGEPVLLNGNVVVTGELIVPGTPSVVINGNPNFGGTITGTGNASPTNYAITLNGAPSLGKLRTRINPIALPTVAPPPAATGTRDVTISTPNQSPGDFATLRDLRLNGNVGNVTVPPGTYRNFVVNGNSSLTLGISGATQPAVYNLSSLTLNGQTELKVVGPVLLTLANGVIFNGQSGNASNPQWLKLNVASGGVTINGGATLYGLVTAPSGTVIINGNSQLIGTVACDKLILNGNALLRTAGIPANQPPLANAGTNQTINLPTNTVTLNGTATDDGQPAFGTTSFAWSKLSGPGSVTFKNASAAQTTATFTQPGIYVLRLTVNDGAAGSSDDIVATVSAQDDPMPGTCLSLPNLVALWTGDDEKEVISGKAASLEKGAAAGTPGKVGRAFKFDGMSGGVDANDIPFLNSLPLTIDAWVRPELRDDARLAFQIPGNPNPFFYPNNAVSSDRPLANGHGFGINVTAAGSQFTIEYHNGFRIIPRVSFDAGQWYHIALVYTVGNVKAYVDGQLVDEIRFPQASVDGVSFLRIGKTNDDIFTWRTERYFKGQIDEVGIYNRALTDAEIQSIYKADAVGRCRPQSRPCEYAKNKTDPHKVPLEDISCEAPLPGWIDRQSFPSLEQILTPPFNVGNAGMGGAIAMDEDTLVIGVPTARVAQAQAQGVVYIYKRQAGKWKYDQTLIAANGKAGDWFGSAVALEKDTLVIGAQEDSNGTGASYVFLRKQDKWTQVTKLIPQSLQQGNNFGASVSLVGQTIAIGAPAYKARDTGGKVHIFSSSADGWHEIQEIRASDGHPQNYFGNKVTADQETLVVGAYGDSPIGEKNRGAAYLFNRRGLYWIESQKFTLLDGKTNDTFGLSLALFGTTLVIGVPGANGGRGKVVLYEREGQIWQPQGMLTVPDLSSNSFYGYSLAANQNTIVVAAINQGAVYSFQKKERQYTFSTKLTCDLLPSEPAFGLAIAIGNEQILIGSPGTGRLNRGTVGAVYVFQK